MRRVLRTTTAIAVALIVVPQTALADKTSPAVGTYKFTGKLKDRGRSVGRRERGSDSGGDDN